MNITNNHIIDGKNGRPIVLDYGYKSDAQQKPVIVFAHGFKGFKDWGHFNHIMEHFIQEGFVFIKFNFSYNGGTIEQPIDFPDLDAFGNNNYCKELDDLRSVIDWIENNEEIPETAIDKNEIYLIGHSRGGGISILATHEDHRIRKLVTWAAVADFMSRLPEDLKEWKEKGVYYIGNARTNQQMPIYYQFVENLMDNKERLNISKAEKALTVPHLIVHGTNDEAVHVNEAKLLVEWNKQAELLLLEGAGHTFGAKHPHTDTAFSEDVKKVLAATIAFLKK